MDTVQISSSDGKYARISDVTAVTAGNCCDVVTNGLLNADELLATFPVVFSGRGDDGNEKCHFHYQGRQSPPMWNKIRYLKKKKSILETDQVARVIPFRCGCINTVNELGTDLKTKDFLLPSCWKPQEPILYQPYLWPALNVLVLKIALCSQSQSFFWSGLDICVCVILNVNP